MRTRLRFACGTSLLLAATCWAGCQSSKTEEHATSNAAEKAMPANTLAQQMLPLLRGAWVKADYLKEVQLSKSPRKAFDLAGPVSEMLINPARLSGDSLVASLGLGNHEGSSMTVYFRPGLHANALPTNYRDYDAPGSFAELSYRTTVRDTALVLTTYNKSRRVLAQTSYQRIPGASLTDLVSLNRAVRHLLFTGRYVGTDSLGRSTRLEFNDNGRVKGLKGFRTYDVTTDFIGGVDLDNLVLDLDSEHRREMSYGHSHDTLRLYAARWVEEEVPTLVQGRLLFTLVRR
ncbi:hypothetical protein ACFST9_23355 [Hymenobacter monticola]|uniref:Lipoprotein n=1 Tax=Hymenobacter monticola TaxID=1705399 RepID=A0ABY4B6N6_9BACT|nr:hypothetical protein [Hymenobacter monticola]UOE33962.1 hypothetical protein MTP16_22965 [Hymenobacter monticola]